MNLSIQFDVLVALVSLYFGYPVYAYTSVSLAHGYPWALDIST